MTTTAESSLTMVTALPMPTSRGTSDLGYLSFPLASSTTADSAWERIIDDRLIEWGRDPSRLADDGVVPPKREVVGWAIRLARILASKGADAPQRVVPNGDGGIVFERWSGANAETIEVLDDGDVYYTAFRASRLVHRERWLRMRD